MVRRRGQLAALVLAGIGALHVAWGRGSSLPFGSRRELAVSVVGAEEVPPPGACYGVAAALAVASALATDLPMGPPGLRRLGRAGAATVLAVRGGFGLAGRTDVLSPGSTSDAFRRLDRRLYAPLCLALAAALATATAPDGRE